MKTLRTASTAVALGGLALFVAGCGCDMMGAPTDGLPDGVPASDGAIADGIFARLGDPRPSATARQLDTFEAGKIVMQKRFDLADGLGPTFNLVSCAGCHEKPVMGGSAGLYRNFFLAGAETSDGAFVAAMSNGPAGGVLRVFHYGDGPARPEVADSGAIFAQRNAIPMFGVGLIAEVSEESILANVDPDDEDGDGVSGRPNFDRGFVGRFGRKAQTVSIEGFIRGPLFNHLERDDGAALGRAPGGAAGGQLGHGAHGRRREAPRPERLEVRPAQPGGRARQPQQRRRRGHRSGNDRTGAVRSGQLRDAPGRAAV